MNEERERKKAKARGRSSSTKARPSKEPGIAWPCLGYVGMDGWMDGWIGGHRRFTLPSTIEIHCTYIGVRTNTIVAGY